MGPDMRASARRIMTAMGVTADKHDRLVNYLRPGSCP